MPWTHATIMSAFEAGWTLMLLNEMFETGL